MYKSASASPIASVCPKLLAHGHVEVSQCIKAKALDKHDSSLMSDGADISVPSVSENGEIKSRNGKELVENGKDQIQNGKDHTQNSEDHKEGDNKDEADKSKEDGKAEENKKIEYPLASLSGKSTEVTVSGTWPYCVMDFISGTNILTAREEEMKINMEVRFPLPSLTPLILFFIVFVFILFLNMTSILIC